MHAVSARQPSESEWQRHAVRLAVCRHVRSNAIVLATRRRHGRHRRRADEPRGRGAHRDREGRGAQAGGSWPAPRSASDAFFPFADGPQLALDAGVGAIIQPGGSVRDEEVVAAIDAAGAAMVATGVRHFRH